MTRLNFLIDFRVEQYKAAVTQHEKSGDKEKVSTPQQKTMDEIGRQ
jgi:hypothetical protein